MIAYNTEWLDALIIKEKAQNWHDKGQISAEKLEELKTAHPSNFYSPNLFVRIGLMIFTYILLLAVAGMLVLMFELDSDTAFVALGFLGGAGCLVFLEKRVIHTGRHKGSGIDDVLLYVGIWAILMSICYNFPYTTPALVYFSITLPFLVVGSVRYLDRFLTIMAFGCSLGIVFLIVKDIPSLALYLLPFSGMLFSALAYILSKKGHQRYNLRHWHPNLGVIEMLALLTFYVSGNYWVVQQAGAEMFQLEQVPMAGFFWAFTFLVPLAYIFGGLWRKDRVMMDIGLACIAASVFSFRYYFHVIPLTWAAVIAGAVLFVTAYFSIRYLHQKEGGAYTYEPDGDVTVLQEVEQQLIEQTIANQPGASPEKTDSFGGGQFGGSGASGEF